MTENCFDPVAHARAMRASGFWVDKSSAKTFAESPHKVSA